MSKEEIFRGITGQKFVTLIDHGDNRCSWVDGKLSAEDQELLEKDGGTVLANKAWPKKMGFIVLRDLDFGTHELIRYTPRFAKANAAPSGSGGRKKEPLGKVCCGDCPPYTIQDCPSGTVPCCVNNVLKCVQSCPGSEDDEGEDEQKRETGSAAKKQAKMSRAKRGRGKRSK